jgi:hypothetical protein
MIKALSFLKKDQFLNIIINKYKEVLVEEIYLIKIDKLFTKLHIIF